MAKFLLKKPIDLNPCQALFVAMKNLFYQHNCVEVTIFSQLKLLGIKVSKLSKTDAQLMFPTTKPILGVFSPLRH
jgi:hypothetical protein